jgi:thiamine pyrophosphate-dependent acetolactate synthase large subunit-like protein
MIKRFALLKKMAEMIPSDHLVVGYCIGLTSYEWWALTRTWDNSIILGSMGCSTPLGIGLAMALPHRKVIVMDSDGSTLMEPGVLPVLGNNALPNLTVVVLDNGAYESIGWKPDGERFRTYTAQNTDIAVMAKGAGIRNAVTFHTLEEFEKHFSAALTGKELSYLVVKTEHQPCQVPVKDIDAVEHKYRFVRYIEKSENIRIIKLSGGRKYLFDK